MKMKLYGQQYEYFHRMKASTSVIVLTPCPTLKEKEGNIKRSKASFKIPKSLVYLAYYIFKIESNFSLNIFLYSNGRLKEIEGAEDIASKMIQVCLFEHVSLLRMLNLSLPFTFMIY